VAEEDAGAAIVSAHTCHAARTLLFRAFDFDYLSDKFVLDAPVEAAFPVHKLYVNCGLSAWHNQYWEVNHHIIVPDGARAISKYTCSHKGDMC
jgi:hypothetical protein